LQRATFRFPKILSLFVNVFNPYREQANLLYEQFAIWLQHLFAPSEAIKPAVSLSDSVAMM
jgi:hypothetical protein